MHKSRVYKSEVLRVNFYERFLVFVDILKELPITLLLRPFNFETLATYVYQYASDEMLEESSFAALIIVLAGLGPVIFLSRTIKKYSSKTN